MTRTWKLYLIFFYLLVIIEGFAYGYDSLDIIYPDGRVAVPCNIMYKGGSYPVNLLFNLSAGQQLLIHSEIMNELGVKDGESISLDFNEKVQVDVHDILSMDLSKITILSSEELLDESQERPFAGVIGPQLFEQYKILELDINNLKLNLLDDYEPAPDSLSMKFQYNNNRMYAEFSPLKDYRLRAMISTQFYETMIDRNCALIAGVENAEFVSCRLGEIDITPYTAIRPLENLSYFYYGYDAVIGNSFWQNFNVIMDFRKNQIILNKVPSANNELFNKEYYNALLNDDHEAVLSYLEKHPDSKVADDAAMYMLKYVLKDERLGADIACRVCDCIFSIYSVNNAAHIISHKIRQSAGDNLYERSLQILEYVRDKLIASNHSGDMCLSIEAQIAELMMDNQQVESGYDYLLAAVFREPDNPEINYQLGRYYQSQGNEIRAWYRYFKAATGKIFSIEAVKKLCEMHNNASFRSRIDISDSADLILSKKPVFYPSLSEMNWNEGNFGLLEFFIFSDENELESLQSAIGIIKRYSNRSKFNAICYYVDNPDKSPLANEYSDEMLNRYNGLGRPSVYINGKSYGFGTLELADPVAIVKNLYQFKNVKSIENDDLSLKTEDGVTYHLSLRVPKEQIGGKYEVILVEDNVLYYDMRLLFLDNIARGLVCSGVILKNDVCEEFSFNDFQKSYRKKHAADFADIEHGVSWVSSYIDQNQCSLVVKIYNEDGNVTGIARSCLRSLED